MTTLFSHFPGSQPQDSLQFISYKGPLKQTPRCIPSRKVLSSKDEFPHIDTILGIEPNPNSEKENREELVHMAHGVEVVDLTCSADNETNCEISGGGGASDDIGSGDVTNEPEGVSMPTSQEDTGDKASLQPALSEGSTQGNEAINNHRSDSEADFSNSYKTDPGLHLGDRPESPRTATPEYRDSEIPTGTIDTINSETVDRAKTQVSELPHRRLRSSPPTNPSIMNIEMPTQVAMTHQQRHPTENKVGRKMNRFPYIETTSSESSSAGSDTDDDHSGNPTSWSCKRKRPLSADNTSRKRQSRGSNTTLSTTRTVPSARRQKPFPTQKKAVSGRLSNARLASTSCGEDGSAQSTDGSGDQDRRRKGRKPSTWCSQSNTESPSTHAPPHANRKTRLPVKVVSPRQVQWRLSDIAFHSLSADVSFLTAIFRACSGPEMLTPSHAVTLLKSIVGDPTQLEDITVKPLTSDTWFLTSWAYLITGAAGCGTGQPWPAPSSLPLNTVDTASLRDYDRPHDDINVDDDEDEDSSETSFEDCDQNSDNCEEYLNDVVEKPSSSRSRIRWSEDDDNRLRKFKNDGKPWGWICKQFPGRSPGAVQVRWHTKLRKNP